MKRFIPYFFAIAVLSSSAVLGSEFSATFTEKRGDITIKGKQYVKNGNIRQVGLILGEKQVTIIRADKKVTWQLFVDNKTYIEYPGAKGDLSQQIAMRAKIIGTVSKTGQEVLDKYKCDLYQFNYKHELSGTGKQWIAQKLGWPIKTEIKADSGDILFLLTDIKQEKQPDKLFEVPKDYRKIQIPKRS